MSNVAVHILNWSRRLLAWLLSAWLVVFTGAVVALALIVSLYYWQTESCVRLSGLVLQLFGITAAAVGIRDTRRMFGKPSFLELVRSWFVAMPGLRSRIISATASSTGSASGFAIGHAWRGAGADPTLESRLTAAEANLKELYERANAAESTFDKHVRTATQNLREEKELRQEAERQLHSKIEAASTDGLHLAALGVFWLACGVIMSTAPNELLRLVG